MQKIAIINGPNLNLVGEREPQYYGTETLDSINNNLAKFFEKKAELKFFQSNCEGDIIDHVHTLKNFNGIVINPAAYTHTSLAIRDAVVAINVPTVEVHLSNIFRRDEFRKHSYFSDICIGVVTGFGPLVYRLAVEALLEKAGTK